MFTQNAKRKCYLFYYTATLSIDHVHIWWACQLKLFQSPPLPPPLAENSKNPSWVSQYFFDTCEAAVMCDQCSLFGHGWCWIPHEVSGLCCNMCSERGWGSTTGSFLGTREGLFKCVQCLPLQQQADHQLSNHSCRVECFRNAKVEKLLGMSYF